MVSSKLPSAVPVDPTSKKSATPLGLTVPGIVSEYLKNPDNFDVSKANGDDVKAIIAATTVVRQAFAPNVEEAITEIARLMDDKLNS